MAKKDKVLKASQVREILGLTDRQLGVRRAKLGKGDVYEHGYPLSSVLQFVKDELNEIEQRRRFLKKAEKNLALYG